MLSKALFFVLIHVARYMSCACVPAGNTCSATLPLAGPGDTSTVAASHLKERGGIIGWEGFPWVAMLLHLVTSSSLQVQPTTEHVHTERSCTGQPHADACFFLNRSPPTLLDSLWFISQ